MEDLHKQFEEAYDAYADVIYRHCYFRIRDSERAKDLTQDTFMRTWEYLARGDDIENIRAFLYRVAHNLSVNETQRRKRHLSLEVLKEEGFEPVGDIEASEDEENNPLRARVFVEMKHLLQRDQTVLILRYVDGLSVQEIANVVGGSANTVSVRIHRALAKLKRQLEKSNKNHE